MMPWRNICMALGNYFTDEGSIARSWRTARTTLLDSLRGGWQASELSLPQAKLKALFIHRNTLEYRLNRISELSGLNLSNFDDRLLL